MSRHPTTAVTESDLTSLHNICMVAASRFSEHAAYMRELSLTPTPPEGSCHPTGNTARLLAEQFEKQTIEASEFARRFMDAAPFDMPVNEDALAFG